MNREPLSYAVSIILFSYISHSATAQAAQLIDDQKQEPEHQKAANQDNSQGETEP